jgi:hypothetical protein
MAVRGCSRAGKALRRCDPRHFRQEAATRLLSPPRALVGTLSGSCQRIPKEHLDRVALIGAVAETFGVEIAAP